MLSIVPFSVLLRRFVVGQWFDISLYSCDPLQDMLLLHHHKQLVIKTMKKVCFLPLLYLLNMEQLSNRMSLEINYRLSLTDVMDGWMDVYTH